MASNSEAGPEVLVVEIQAHDRPLASDLLPAQRREVVRARSVEEARARLAERKFDLVVADDSRLRAILDGLFAVVGVFTPEGVIVDTNRAPLVESGLEPSAVLGHKFVDLPWFSHAPAERERVAAAIGRAARGEGTRFETNILRTRGGVMYVDAAFAPLRAADGTITHVLGSGVDVTARHYAEEELAHSRARLAEAQRFAHVGSWEWEVGSDRVDWSDELYAVYGIERPQFDGTYKGFLARVHPDDRDSTISVVRDALETCSAFIYDHRVLRPNGDVRMLHTRGQVVTDEARRAERLVGSCWDVTERWLATQALERSEAELHAILERVSDGFVALDREWRYTYVNNCAGKMFNRDAASLVGKHIWTEFPDGVGQPFHLAYERAAATQKPVQLRDYYVPWNRWFENRIYPSPDGLTIFFTDITEQMQAEEDLRASREQLRALAARLDAIREEERRTISREIHDRIGQDLTALALDFAWLRTRLPEGDAEARERTEQMRRLIDGTLATARRVAAELRPVLLEDLGLGEAIAWQAREFEKRTGIVCSVDAAAQVPSGVPSAAQLTLYRILQEALTNVARHAGARLVSIHLAPSGDGKHLVLSIQDDGRGITEQELARRTSLGLLGMHERALVVGGDVAVRGVAGSGTRVTARVPIQSGPGSD